MWNTALPQFKHFRVLYFGYSSADITSSLGTASYMSTRSMNHLCTVSIPYINAESFHGSSHEWELEQHTCGGGGGVTGVLESTGNIAAVHSANTAVLPGSALCNTVEYSSISDVCMRILLVFGVVYCSYSRHSQYLGLQYCFRTTHTPSTCSIYCNTLSSWITKRTPYSSILRSLKYTGTICAMIHAPTTLRVAVVHM